MAGMARSINPFAKSGFIRAATKPYRRRFRRWSEVSAYKLLARLNRPHCRGRFIAVTGSSAKTTTTSLLAHVLEGHGRVEAQVLGNTISDISKTIAATRRDDDFVVIEAGTTAKGKIAEIARVVRPDVAVVTMVGLEHYSAFRSREAIAAEKGDLVAALPRDGLAVLNIDDELVAAMADRTAARCVTYGRAEGADYRIVSTAFNFPGPLVVDIEWKGGAQRLTAPLVGEHFSLSVTAAFATAMELGVPVHVAAAGIASYEPVSNRCQIVRTRNGPTFLLDAAKSPLGTLKLAFDVIAKADMPKKRVVLGQISDYRGNSRKAHKSAYEMARAVAERVTFVGPYAHHAGATAEDRDEGRFTEFADARSVYEYLRGSAAKDELVLVKSSSGSHLERVVLAFDHDVKCWKNRCGFTISCFECGLYEHPFDQHAAIRRRNRKEDRNRIFRRLSSGPQ